MKNRYFIFALFFTVLGTLSAQKESKADQFYFEYAYREAVKAYQDEMKEYQLTPEQQINLADAYFRIGQYDNSAETFMEVYKKDSVMTNAHFNTMLQALSKTSGPDRARAFLSTRSGQLSEALLENTAFNYQTMEDPSTDQGTYRIFPLDLNSAQADFAPSFFGADQLLFSSSRPMKDKETYTPSGESYLDIYTARLQPDGQASMPAPVSWIPSIKYHQATSYYSEGLDAVFYVRSNMDEEGLMAFDPNGKNTLGICRTSRNGAFQYLLRDLSTSFYYPFYDDSSGKLYFAADFEKGHGGTDLYYVYTNNGQIMSEPVNLGPQVNTPGNEIAPFVIEGSLYFSSDVFYGIGGMDVYKSEIQDDFYSIPVNLGREINSSSDEFGFIIRTNPQGGYTGYFSSNREGGSGNDDIYGFTIDQKPGMKTLLFRGTVQEFSGMGIEKAFVRLYDSESNLLKEAYTDEEGDFRLEIPWRENVSIRAGRDRFETVDVGNTSASEALSSGKPLNIQLTSIESVLFQRADQTLLKLDPFYFERGRTQVTPEIAAELDLAAESLIKFPEIRLRIEAHTDSRGSKAANLQLSEKRAEAIRDYLISKGVGEVSIPEVTGYGEQQIINNCTDGVYCLDMLHKQNERYPFVVLNYNDL